MKAARTRLRVKYWHEVLTGWKAEEMTTRGLLRDGETLRITTSATTNEVVRVQYVAVPPRHRIGYQMKGG